MRNIECGRNVIDQMRKLIRNLTQKLLLQRKHKSSAKKRIEKAITDKFVLVNKTPIMQEDVIFRERGNG